MDGSGEGVGVATRGSGSGCPNELIDTDSECDIRASRVALSSGSDW